MIAWLPYYAALLAIVAACAWWFLLRPRFALPSRELRAWNTEARALVQHQLDCGVSAEKAQAFRYAWGATPGDHDDKLVWRVHVEGGKLRTFVAPVDRRGRRVGPSRRVLIR